MLRKALVVPPGPPIEVEPRSSSAGIGRFAADAAAPGPGDVELNFVYSGGQRYFVGGRFVEVGAGQLSLFWGALPHQISALEPATEYMYARVPLVTLMSYNLPSPFLRKLLGGEVLVDAHSPQWEAELTRRWVTDRASGDSAALRASALEIEARLRRLSAKRQQRAAPRAPEHKARGQIEAITAFLADHYQGDV